MSNHNIIRDFHSGKINSSIKKLANTILGLCLSLVILAGMTATASASNTTTYQDEWISITNIIEVFEFVMGGPGLSMSAKSPVEITTLVDITNISVSTWDSDEEVIIPLDKQELFYNPPHPQDEPWTRAGAKIILSVPGTYFISMYECTERHGSGNGGSSRNPQYVVTILENTPATVQATPNASTVLVNSAPVAFDAYTINSNNYFKLRDLAHVLNGTNKQFEVKWDGAQNAILLTAGTPYTAVGGEMQGKGTGSKDAISSSSKILVDGKEVSLTAYTIGGNNYFKLRDIAQVFDFGVIWDGKTNTIRIDTATGYIAEAPKSPSFPGGVMDDVLGMTIEEVVAIWGPYNREDLLLPSIQYSFNPGMVVVNVSSGQVYDVLLWDDGSHSIHGFHVGMTEAAANAVVTNSTNIQRLRTDEMGANKTAWTCVIKGADKYISNVIIPYEEYYSKEKELGMIIFFENGMLDFMSYTVQFIIE